MSAEASELKGPDLTRGVPESEVEDGGMLLGHAGGEAVLLVRQGVEAWAVGATCTHYGGPLAEGLVVGDTVRCPWHHACFSLRTGEALKAPALNLVPCWRVERREGRLFVTSRVEPPPIPSTPAADAPERLGSVVILGTGAAGSAAAEMLRREGFAGRVTLIGAEDTVPYDRPNLSKDYLAGTAPEEWIPLRSRDFYAEHGIELALGTPASGIDTRGRRVVLADGSEHPFDALLVAIGAEPVRLDVPGADLPHVRYLRTLADSRALIVRAERAERAVVVGASFIGLEAAAALRTRGLEVHVVAPDRRPLERVFGPELGDLVRALHEERGVVFDLGRTVREVRADSVVLEDGGVLAADLVVVGIGVRPLTGLAERAGIATDRGILVDERLETNVPGVFAAGDVARYPDPRFGGRIRVEHWVAAQRQGQAAARSLLGRREPFRDVPFFWSRHYDVAISYVGHAERWDRIDLEGSLEERDCTAVFRSGGETLAVATVSRDVESLRAEVAMERGDRAALARLAAPAYAWGGAMSERSELRVRERPRTHAAGEEGAARRQRRLARAVRRQLELLGEDPERAGLLRTPRRVSASLAWLTRGYRLSARGAVGDAVFEEEHSEMVLVRDIEMYSLCEHHLLPFFGRVHVAYVPDGRIVGLSKLPRVVEVFARRLQVQERLTRQIADAVVEVLRPRGVGVVVEAAHLCMMMRGVEKQGSRTVTSALRGLFLEDARTRDEFFRLVHAAPASPRC